jgi:hypothetical protein
MRQIFSLGERAAIQGQGCLWLESKVLTPAEFVKSKLLFPEIPFHWKLLYFNKLAGDSYAH